MLDKRRSGKEEVIERRRELSIDRTIDRLLIFLLLMFCMMQCL